MRIGLFGGTFDPPHRAHLQVARAAANRFVLDRVLLAPAGVQPLKQETPGASYPDRLAMVKLMCQDDPRLEASDLDAPREDGQPNYTIDALDELHRREPSAQLFAIVGADSFLTLRRWREPEQLLAAADWIVVSRPGFSLDDLAPLNLAPEQHSRIHLLTELDEDISATGIRERLRLGVSCESMLTPPVALYIARMRLYGTH